jgi:16S rRNA A1518/A1519 N6-dimethyltransferase RsmA/KsgA/DIM1 with predicted DNA glycosylase/AP lyase activity
MIDTMYITIFLISIFILVIAIFAMFNLFATVSGAPFVPIPRDGLEKISGLLALSEGNKVVDMGSGVGTISLYLADSGADVTGIDINPVLVWISRIRAILTNGANVSFIRENFWKVDLSNYDTVVMYCIPYQMTRMKKKIEHEMESGSRITTYGFRFPDWEPTITDDKVYLYILP